MTRRESQSEGRPAARCQCFLRKRKMGQNIHERGNAGPKASREAGMRGLWLTAKVTTKKKKKDREEFQEQGGELLKGSVDKEKCFTPQVLNEGDDPEKKKDKSKTHTDKKGGGKELKNDP